MKKLILKWTAIFSVLLSSSLAWSISDAVNKYTRKVGLQIYNLQTLTSGVLAKDIKQYNGPASAGMNYDIAGQIIERYMAATELLILIIQDQSLSKEEKRPLISDLMANMMELTITVSRQHGEDNLFRSAKTRDMIRQARDLQKAGNESEARRIFDEVSKIDDGPEYLLEQKQLKNRIFKVAQAASSELVGTFTDFFITRTGDRQITFEEAQEIIEKGSSTKTMKTVQVSKMKDKAIRDIVGQTLGIILQKAVQKVGDLPDVEKGDDALRFQLVYPIDKKKHALDDGVAERVLRIRNDRKTGHAVVLGLGAVVAGIWAVMPIDYVGTVLSSYDFATFQISEMITVSALTVMGLVKYGTSSFNSIPVFNLLKNMVEKPSEASQMSVSQVKYSLLSKILGVRKNLTNARLAVYENGDRPISTLDSEQDRGNFAEGKSVQTDGKKPVGLNIRSLIDRTFSSVNGQANSCARYYRN